MILITTTISLTEKLLLFTLTSILALGCNEKIECDLIIENATILDVETGNLLPNKSIVIHKGKIKDMLVDPTAYSAKQTIVANNKLVTPSFVDTHIHPTDVFGDRENAPISLGRNSRKKLSESYLPYGTTTTLILGQPEGWLDTIIDWQKNPNPLFSDHYTAGGALISKENRMPYVAHSVVENPQESKSKVIEYHRHGLNHIKLYYRLKRAELESAFKTADSLNMRVFGHIGGFELENQTIAETLPLGIKNYEHIATLPNSVLDQPEDWEKVNESFDEHFGSITSESKVLEYMLELFRYAANHKKTELEELIDRMAAQNVSYSTTIHLLYQTFHKTYFTTPIDTSLTTQQTERCIENFKILMKYTKRMHDKGIQIRLGSDTKNGGQVNISELILLCDYGFPVSDVFKIASINGAAAIGVDDEAGSLKKGKNANLILWDKSPFDDAQNFAESKTVLKDGKIYKSENDFYAR